MRGRNPRPRRRPGFREAPPGIQAHGHVGTNVAGETIDGALPAMPAVKAHFRALPWAEVGAALDAVRHVPGISPSSRLCLEFLVLTAARPW